MPAKPPYTLIARSPGTDITNARGGQLRVLKRTDVNLAAALTVVAGYVLRAEGVVVQFGRALINHHRTLEHAP